MFIGFGAVVNCAGIVAGGLAGMLFRSQTQKTKTFGEVPLSLSWFCRGFRSDEISKLGNQCNVVRVSGRRMTNRAPHPSSFSCLKPSSIRISAS